jgi:hypothetical protein
MGCLASCCAAATAGTSGLQRLVQAVALTARPWSPRAREAGCLTAAFDNPWTTVEVVEVLLPMHLVCLGPLQSENACDVKDSRSIGRCEEGGCRSTVDGDGGLRWPAAVQSIGIQNQSRPGVGSLWPGSASVAVGDWVTRGRERRSPCPNLKIRVLMAASIRILVQGNRKYPQVHRRHRRRGRPYSRTIAGSGPSRPIKATCDPARHL